MESVTFAGSMRMTRGSCGSSNAERSNEGGGAALCADALAACGYCGTASGFLHRVYASTNDDQSQRGPPGWATLLFIDVLMMKVRT